MTPFDEACVASPIGAVLVARLEQQLRSDMTRIMDDPTADSKLVRDAAATVLDMTFAELCAEVLTAAQDVGPDTLGAALEAWAAYQCAEDRLPIAKAMSDKFGDDLHAPLKLEDQAVWPRDPREIEVVPLFEALNHVYRSGEVPLAALRSCGRPKPAVVDIESEELARYSLEQVTYSAPDDQEDLAQFDAERVFEIHRAVDWLRLCELYPQPARGSSTSWAFPGPYADESGHSRLVELENQNAAIDVVVGHTCPSWESVADDYDVVHLSWAGFITAEGYVLNRRRRTTMLRHWEREVALWLNPVQGMPGFRPRDQK